MDEILVVNGEPGSVPLAADGPGIERLALNVGGRNLGVLVLRGESRELSVADHRILRAFSDQLALVLERDRMLAGGDGSDEARGLTERLDLGGAVDPGPRGWRGARHPVADDRGPQRGLRRG